MLRRGICMGLHHVEVCTQLYIMQAGFCWKCRLRNWGMYLGISCGLTQPRGILGVWDGLLQRAKL